MAAPKPKVREDLVHLELDGEGVVYDEQSDDVHHLNPEANVVFGLLDGTATVEEIAAEIAAAFRLPVADVEQQVRVLLRDFRKVRLLEGSLDVSYSAGQAEPAARPDAREHDDHDHDAHARAEHDHEGHVHEHDDRDRIRKQTPGNP